MVKSSAWFATPMYTYEFGFAETDALNESSSLTNPSILCGSSTYYLNFFTPYPDDAGPKASVCAFGHSLKASIEFVVGEPTKGAQTQITGTLVEFEATIFTTIFSTV